MSIVHSKLHFDEAVKKLSWCCSPLYCFVAFIKILAVCVSMHHKERREMGLGDAILGQSRCSHL